MSVNSHHFYCTPGATKWTPIIRDKQVPLSQFLSTCPQVWSFKTGINTFLITFEVLVCFTHTPALWNCYALWSQTRGSSRHQISTCPTVTNKRITIPTGMEKPPGPLLKTWTQRGKSFSLGGCIGLQTLKHDWKGPGGQWSLSVWTHHCLT